MMLENQHDVIKIFASRALVAANPPARGDAFCHAGARCSLKQL
jgi:hypothetical protein